MQQHEYLYILEYYLIYGLIVITQSLISYWIFIFNILINNNIIYISQKKIKLHKVCIKFRINKN